MDRVDMTRLKKFRRGFTLIELLIVIAIILILIAIALPNFLEAQIRAKVTKARGEIRSITIALESYALDFNVYPAQHERNDTARTDRGLFWLTSPIAYITSIPEDPFNQFTADSSVTTYVTYEFGGMEVGGTFIANPCPVCEVTWALFSNGPDGLQNIWQDNPHHNDGNPTYTYSPTNGTKSIGEIIKWGGDPQYIGYRIPSKNSAAQAGGVKGLTPVGLPVDGQVYVRRLPITP